MKARTLMSLVGVMCITAALTATFLATGLGTAHLLSSESWVGIGMMALLGAALVWCDPGPPAPDTVDIWDYQKELMRMSEQSLPSGPMLTKQGVMYIAITMEELAETAEAARMALLRERLHRYGRSDLAFALAYSATQMAAQSKQIKHILSEVVEDFHIFLPREDATALLDGVTDVAVTTAGMGLSMGLPARGGYREVCTSNHSKADPATGLIAKDSSGKWIKGANYRPPNFEHLLADCKSLRQPHVVEP